MPITISSLQFIAGGKSLIDNLDLYVSSAGISVILGPNGAGKSLLFRLIHGLLPANNGKILWGRKPISASVRQHQAFVTQKPVLLRRTVRQNVEFVLKLRRQKNIIPLTNELLEKVELLSHADQPARSLSGGEQQRLSLARALAINPSVLMLDEATANLDPLSTFIIEKILLSLKRSGVKVLLVTHDLGQAKRLADDIIFLHRGRVVENTNATNFFSQPDTSIARAFLEGELIQ